MSPVEHPADDCRHCDDCADYIAWLESQVMAIAQSYNGLAEVLRAQAELATTTTELAGLYNRSREIVQNRRLHQIEQHMPEDDDPGP